MKRLLLLPWVAAAVLAQAPAVIAPPVLGYAYDAASNRLLRAAGVPGAAVLDESAELCEGAEAAFPAPAGGYALLRTESGAALMRLGANEGITPLPGALGPARVAFSPEGGAAALADGRRMQVWTRLGQTPLLAADLELAAAPAAFAVSERGDLALAMADSIQVAGRAVATGMRVTALAFPPDGNELLAADAGTNRILAIALDGTPAAARLLAAEADGIADPVAVAYSRDGRRRFAANAENAVFELDGAGAVRVLACDCRIDGLHPLRGNAVFRLADPPKGRSPLFDGDADESRIVFFSAGGAQ